MGPGIALKMPEWQQLVIVFLLMELVETMNAMEQKGVKDGMESCKGSKRMSNLMRPGSGAVCGSNERGPCVVERFETRLKSFVRIAHDLTCIGGLKKLLLWGLLRNGILEMGQILFRISLN